MSERQESVFAVRAVTPRHEPLSWPQLRLVALCCCATFLDGYDLQALGLAVPLMAEAFGLAQVNFTVAVTATLVGMSLGAAGIAPLADRWGRRPLSIVSMAVIGATSLAVTLADTPIEVGIWRALTGLALGALVPVITAMATDLLPLARRTTVLAFIICCIPIGGFVASATAPLLSRLWGWQAIFLAGGLLPLAIAAVLAVALPESAPRLEAGTARPAMPLSVIVSRQYRRRTFPLWVIWSMNLFVNLSLISWLPSLLRAADWSHDAALYTTSVAVFGGVIGALVLATLVDRGRLVPALGTAYLAAAGAMLAMVLLPDSRWMWVTALAVVGFGTFGSQITFGALAASYYPSSIRSTGVGWATGVGRVGAIVGPLVVASMMRGGFSGTSIIVVLMVPLVACASCLRLLPRTLDA